MTAEKNLALKGAGARWELDDLYRGPNDPKITADIQEALSAAENYHRTYHDRLLAADCTPETLIQALRTLETIHTTLLRLNAYAYLAFTVATDDDVLKSLHAKCQEITAQAENLLLFFELEIQQIPAERFAQFTTNEELQHYRHYLDGVRLFAPYTLSEKEEQVINKKNLSGRQAFVNFYQELTASFTWELEVDGEQKVLTGEEVRNLLRRPEAKLRERAKRAYDSRYGEHVIVFTNVFNAIVKDHALETEMRGYHHPMEASHLRNRVTREVVETMMEVTTAHNDLAQKYYILKARLLAMQKVRGCDLIAPVAGKRETIPFDEGKQLILSAFEQFSGELAGYARQMFERRWIHAEVKPNKRTGAYCYGIVPELHPYIMMSYNDDLDNVYTLAHELGHAVHDFYAGRKQTLFNYHPPLVAAETASVFAEMLLTQKLLEEISDRDMRLAILTGKLEDLFATIHTQNYYTRFELDAHRAGQQERLSANTLCEMWNRRRNETYGESVEFLPEQQWYWAAIPHFIHTRFYCYAYTFGALLVLALYNQYRQDGAHFVPRYLQLLESGGSLAPADLVAQIGFDIHQPQFWEGGFQTIAAMLDELEGLVRA